MALLLFALSFLRKNHCRKYEFVSKNSNLGQVNEQKSSFSIKMDEKRFFYSEKLIFCINVFICKYLVLLCYFLNQECLRWVLKQSRIPRMTLKVRSVLMEDTWNTYSADGRESVNTLPCTVEDLSWTDWLLRLSAQQPQQLGKYLPCYKKTLFKEKGLLLCKCESLGLIRRREKIFFLVLFHSFFQM